MTTGYKVIKIFNNNVVLAQHHGVEKILIKKGLGFQYRLRDSIPDDTVFEKIFTLENSDVTPKFNQLFSQVEGELIGICEEILGMISNELHEPIAAENHLRLIDHLTFTIYRLRQHDLIENPFIAEIETLYAREFELAQRAITLLEQKTGIAIPVNEAGFIALHLHTLRTPESLSNTIKYAFICNSVLELLEDELGITIDRKSIDYARFTCHIRFTTERILKGIPIQNQLLPMIKKAYKRSYKLALKITELMGRELKTVVPDDEAGYITLHIERLKRAQTT